jgi:hypothetical protein
VMLVVIMIQMRGDMHRRVAMMICCRIEIFYIDCWLHTYLVLVICIVQGNVAKPMLVWEDDPLFHWI